MLLHMHNSIFFSPDISVGFTNESVIVPEDILPTFELCVAILALNNQQMQLSQRILALIVSG